MYEPLVQERPQDFKTLEEWPEYNLASDIPSAFHGREVGEKPRGVRWGLGPLKFENYFGDEEPLSSHRPCFIRWQRVFRHDVPTGWHERRRATHLIGFWPVSVEDHGMRWSESARRYLKKWKRETGNHYHIDNLTYPEFEAAYLASGIGKKIGRTMLSMVTSRLGSGLTLRFRGVRERKTGRLAAGVAIFESPSARAAHYHSGFYGTEGGRDHAMLGLFDQWFSEANERGLRYLLLGRFRLPGNPKSWQGFSRFKAQFGLQYVLQPPLLWRFFL